MREDYVSISPAQLRAGGQQDIDYMLDRPPFTRYYWNGEAFKEMGAASGAPYLGPQTMAELQAGAYADGTPALAALAKDTVVYDTDLLCSYVPNAAGTAWTVGRSAQSVSIADLAARNAAGRPVPVGVQVSDPATGEIYGQSDGAGGYSGLHATFSQVTAGIAADGNTATLVKPAGVSRCAVSATGSVDYAAIYVEDADTGAIYGAFGAPMSGTRWCAVPAAAFNLRGRIAGFAGTSMTLTLAGGV